MLLLLTLFNAAVLLLVLWNAVRWPAVRPGAEAGAPRVSILIPARNEAARIGPCLDAALAQGSDVLEVLVYDDDSEDATDETVRAAAEGEPRLRLLSGAGPPPGWRGKPHACQRLADAARGDWMLFLDADARLRPGAVPAMLAAGAGRDATLLSAWPGLEMRSFSERLLMPMLHFVVFTLFPAPLSLKRMRDPALGIAHGACILTRRDAYRRVGGHERVRRALFEDTELARAWREAGERGVCLDGRHVVRVRMYAGFREIWLGFLKNFRPAFRSGRSFWAFWGFHAVCFFAPFLWLAAALGLGRPANWAWAACACVVAMRAVQAVRFRFPLWSCLLHPVAEALLLALGLHSWRRWRRGGGVAWKGRRYEPSNAGEEAA